MRVFSSENSFTTVPVVRLWKNFYHGDRTRPGQFHPSPDCEQTQSRSFVLTVHNLQLRAPLRPAATTTDQCVVAKTSPGALEDWLEGSEFKEGHQSTMVRDAAKIEITSHV
jgi:hypothetical protein